MERVVGDEPRRGSDFIFCSSETTPLVGFLSLCSDSSSWTKWFLSCKLAAGFFLVKQRLFCRADLAQKKNTSAASHLTV